MQTKQLRINQWPLVLATVFMMGSCNKRDSSGPSEVHLTRQTAMTADEAVKKPGIYEQTYIIKDRVYKVDVQYHQNAQGQMIVEPISNSKDINEFLEAVKGKNYSILEAHVAFGTYLLEDSSASPATTDALFTKYISPIIETNMRQLNSQSQLSANKQEDNLPALTRTTGSLIYFKINDSRAKQRAARTDFSYATLYQNKNFGGSTYKISLNDCDVISKDMTSSYALLVGSQNYVGKNFNDKTSSLSVSFDDGLGALTAPTISLQIYQNQNWSGYSHTFVFTKPANPCVIKGVNIDDISMWSGWSSSSPNWNDKLSSFKIRLEDKF